MREDTFDEFALLSVETVSCERPELLHEVEHVVLCADLGEDLEKGTINI